MVEAIHKAVSVKGVDEATIIEIITKFAQIRPEYREEKMKLFKDSYMEKYGKPIEEVFKKALVGNLETVVLATLNNDDSYLQSINPIVCVDNEGYSYVDVEIKEENNWITTIEGVTLPENILVEEVRDIKRFDFMQLMVPTTYKSLNRVWDDALGSYIDTEVEYTAGPIKEVIITKCDDCDDVLGEVTNPKTGVSNLLILLIPLGILSFITIYVNKNKSILKSL